jgi:Peptidase of plants and bacteria
MHRLLPYAAWSLLCSCLLCGMAAGGGAASPASSGPDSGLARFVVPLAPPPATDATAFVVDLHEVPESRAAAAWAAEAQSLCTQWFPVVCRFLATEGWTPPKQVTLAFVAKQAAPGATTGGTIRISVPWIEAHPDDFGMVIHELTHVVQSYPSAGNKPGWLVEGIADWVRWWRYEPESPRTPIDRAHASYRDGYRTTAAFLAWTSARYDRRLLRTLDRALRTGTYSDALWEQATGKGLDALWAEFVANAP